MITVKFLNDSSKCRSCDNMSAFFNKLFVVTNCHWCQIALLHWLYHEDPIVRILN